MDTIKNYDNGLTLIVSEGGALSCSFAIMIGTGSVNETNENNGISHYIEHMTFKGTNKYNSYEITEILDNNGASFNAYTSNETTCFYAQTIVDKLESTFSVMSNMVYNSTYPDDEAKKEKGVIIEEIKMSNDNPEDVCFDLAASAYFGNSGYGRTILGTSKNVASFKKQDILRYLKDYYTAENTVISFAGNLTLKEAERLVEEYVLPYVNTSKTASSTKRNISNKKQFLSRDKDVEQVHFCLTFPSVSYDSPSRVASEMAVALLGGGMSSRLFRKIREELGLAYSVYSFASRYKDVGTVSIYAGLNGDKVDSGFNAVIDLINNLNKNGITEAEFTKVKNSIKASTVFALEKPSTKVQLFSRYYLATKKLYKYEDRIKALDSVMINDVLEKLKEFDFNNMSSAIVGKNVKPLKI